MCAVHLFIWVPKQTGHTHTQTQSTTGAVLPPLLNCIVMSENRRSHTASTFAERKCGDARDREEKKRKYTKAQAHIRLVSRRVSFASAFNNRQRANKMKGKKPLTVTKKKLETK